MTEQADWFFPALFFTVEQLQTTQLAVLQELAYDCQSRDQLARDLAHHLYETGLLVQDEQGDTHCVPIQDILSETLLFQCFLWFLTDTADPALLPEWTRAQAGWYGGHQQPARQEESSSSDETSSTVIIDLSALQHGRPVRPWRGTASKRAARSSPRSAWRPPGSLSLVLL